MIFTTVGTQLPFDRLIRSLDDCAAADADIEVFAQIGRSNYQPEHFAWTRTMQPQEFRRRVAQCDTVVAHAGMGSIISAIEMGKRVIVMPRRASLGEHRNEHQLATAARLEHLQGLEVVNDAEELAIALSSRQKRHVEVVQVPADAELLATIRKFAGLAAV